VFLLVLSLTVAVAQKKSECPYMAGNKSCCESGNKASMTKAGTKDANVMLVSNKKADTKTAQTAKKAECTEADKAQCDMHKASTASKSAKMDCCKDKSAKTAKAEKKAPEKSEAKGTN
jgi:hypothetical protein